MMDFEVYDIAAWTDRGMETPLATRAHATPAHRNVPFKSRILLPVVAMSAILSNAVVPMSQYFVSTLPQIAHALSGDSGPPFPERYWTAAIVALKHAPVVEESGPKDPPPRY
jgi:hypothetical protein